MIHNDCRLIHIIYLATKMLINTNGIKIVIYIFYVFKNKYHPFYYTIKPKKCNFIARNMIPGVNLHTYYFNYHLSTFLFKQKYRYLLDSNSNVTNILMCK